MTNWKGAGAGVVWLELLQLVLVGCVARLVARGVVCAGTHYVDTLYRHKHFLFLIDKIQL